MRSSLDDSYIGIVNQSTIIYDSHVGIVYQRARMFDSLSGIVYQRLRILDSHMGIVHQRCMMYLYPHSIEVNEYRFTYFYREIMVICVS